MVSEGSMGFSLYGRNQIRVGENEKDIKLVMGIGESESNVEVLPCQLVGGAWRLHLHQLAYAHLYYN